MVQRGRNGKSKASGEAEEATKGARILEIVASGATIREAAQQVGVSAHWGGVLYQRQLTKATEETGPLRRLLLAQDLETLRLLIKAHMPAAVGEMVTIDEDGVVLDHDGEESVDTRHIVVKAPDHQSAKIVLSALDRRAKLLGMDAAIRVEVSNANVAAAVEEIDQLITDATPDELAEVLPIDARRLAQ